MTGTQKISKKASSEYLDDIIHAECLSVAPFPSPSPIPIPLFLIGPLGGAAAAPVLVAMAPIAALFPMLVLGFAVFLVPVPGAGAGLRALASRLSVLPAVPVALETSQ